MKRRIFAAFLLICVLLSGALPVYAENNASYIENITTVTSNAIAQVTLKVNIHLDSAVETITFPVPLNAKDVKVNGNSARATRSGGALQVDISSICGGYAGDYSLRFDFTLENVVTLVEKKLQLEIPILCGFAYPITEMDFAITLPDTIDKRPYFTGGYRQSTMESVLNIAVQDNMISGTTTTALVDYETVTMTLEVPSEMFPTVSTYEREGNPEVILMLIVGAVALLYWLIFLRAMPILRTRRTTPPEGVTAGELGCRLTFAGADLTMMVFSWAQLGYILIQVDDSHRVILHKRMDMGNERSLFEVKTFKALFANRRAVDGTGSHYARLALEVSQQVPGEKAMCSSSSGNIRIFRTIGSGILAVGGVCFAMNLTDLTVLQVLLGTIFGLFGIVCAWSLQGGMYRIHLRNKRVLTVSLVLGAVWIVLSIVAGVALIGIVGVLSQLLIGLAAAYGGRRSDMGRTNAQNIVSFRHYLTHIPKEDTYQLCKADPEAFFSLIPYALAMGVEDKYARCFLRRKIPTCPYLVIGNQNRRSAESWARSMRRVADTLDERWHHMQLEKFAIIHITK